MTCGGSMMRASQNPLAGLIDAVSAEWLLVEHLSTAAREHIYREITGQFDIGDRQEITFHGLEYQLTIERINDERTNDLASRPKKTLKISVHQIKTNT